MPTPDGKPRTMELLTPKLLGGVVLLCVLGILGLVPLAECPRLYHSPEHSTPEILTIRMHNNPFSPCTVCEATGKEPHLTRWHHFLNHQRLRNQAE